MEPLTEAQREAVRQEILKHRKAAYDEGRAVGRGEGEAITVGNWVRGILKIRYRAGYKYQLAEDYTVRVPILPPEDVITDWYALTASGVLLVKKGYAWDGASGPTFDTKSSMRPSLIHDVFCQMMRARLLDYDRWHDAVNALFKAHCIEDGMWRWRAALWHAAVEFANSGHPDQGEANPIQEAP